jgi:hypothetical protein
MTTEQLKQYDFFILIDKSGSMSTRDCPGNLTRWKAAEEATIALARKCDEFDDDGITVITFSNNFNVYDNVKGGDYVVEKIFRENGPSGSTDTAKVLNYVFNEYTGKSGLFSGLMKSSKNKPKKPIIVLVITDGVPDSQSGVIDAIVNVTKKIGGREEIGLNFLQVGRDRGARDFLKMLDDELVKKGAKFDIVDTKTFEEMGDMLLADVLLNSLTD